MSAQSKLDILLKWIDDNEIEWEKDLIQVKDVNNSLGVFAKTDIEEGLPVVKIPKLCVLSPKTTGIANVFEDEHIEGGCSLALAVMYEIAQGEDSPWYGYLQALPFKEDLPVFWSEDEQALLQGTEMEDALKNDKDDLRDDYDNIVKPLFAKYPYIFPKDQIENHYDFDSFCKISTLVSSRAFEVDAYHENAMVPFADIFNHRSGDEHVHFETDFDVCDACGALDYCEHRFLNGDESDDGEDDGWDDVDDDAEEDIEESEGEDDEEEEEEEDDDDGDESDKELQDLETLEKEGVDFYSDDNEDPEKDTCDLVMDRSAKKGEELFNTYGEHPNVVLLSKYGFCEENNANDFVTVDEDMVIDNCVDLLAKVLKEKGIKATEEEVINYVRMRWEFFIMNESTFIPDEDSEDMPEGDHEGDGCGCGHDHGSGDDYGREHSHDHEHSHEHSHEHDHEHDHDHEGGEGCCDHDHGDEEDEEDEEEEPYRPRPYRLLHDGTFEDSLKLLLHIVFVDEQMFSKFLENIEMAMGYFAELADSEQKPKSPAKKNKKSNKKKPVDIFANVKRSVNQVLRQLVINRQKAYSEPKADGDVKKLQAETNQRKRYALMCRISEKQILERGLVSYSS